MMPDWGPSSRKRFERYRDRLRRRMVRAGGGSASSAMSETARDERAFLSLLMAFFGLLRSHHMVIGLCLTTVAVSTLLGLLPLYGTKIVFDSVLSDHPLPSIVADWAPIPRDPKGLLWAVAAGMVGLALISLMIGMVGRWHMTRVNKRVQSEVRRRAFEHAVRLPLHRVHKLKSGGVTSILSEDAGAVGDLLFAMLYNPWRAIIQLLGCLFILAWTDWRLLGGALTMLPVVWVTHRTWIGRIRPMYKDIRASRQHVAGHATEVFSGMRIVRGFNRQRSESGRFTTNNHYMARQELLAWWWARGVDIVWSILIPVASAGILTFGGMRILNDMAAVEAGTLAPHAALTLGELVMFLTYLAWLLDPIATLASSATQFQNGLAGLDRILDLLEEPQDLPDNPRATVVDKATTPGRVTLRDVWFTYPGGRHPVIRGINLDVLPGQTIALVGRSGSGKTTLCNLVARFFDPTRGRIELDGHDLRDVQIDSYRRLLGIVEQDVFLFDGTVRDNIAYANRDAGDDQILHAAEMASAHDFITQLDAGYDTLIGERGVKLSGGQRQRLAIARAILASPRILILDEATSNLDTQSERLIQASMRALVAERTCFVIAHRLSTIAHADWIVVLENGRIIEQGRHEQLIARSGRYRYMVDLQTQPTEEDDLQQEDHHHTTRGV